MYQIDVDKDEEYLSQIPLNLIKESIRDQINDPVDNFKKDYVQSFIDKYNFTKENRDEEDGDEGYNLDTYYTDFISFMEKILYDNFSIAIPDLDDMSEDDQLDAIQLTYRFLITRIKKNFIGVVLNYIESNSNLILDTFPEKKDVTTLNYRDIVNDVDLRVLSNLDSIIDLALERAYDVIEFIDACAYVDDSLETSFMFKAFENDTLTGNFVELYTHMVDSDLRGEIASKVRNKIFKKYPLKKKKND